MNPRNHRGFTATEKAKMWDRWLYCALKSVIAAGRTVPDGPDGPPIFRSAANLQPGFVPSPA